MDKKKLSPSTPSVKGTEKTTQLPKNSASNKLHDKKSFPIVGIGASAGGLEAFTQLLENLPAYTGMAFVLIQHLAPTHESMLTEILSKATTMPVTEVKDGMVIEPDHVYVIPPNTNMAILHGVLTIMRRIESRGQHMPVNYFLHSLSEDQKNNAIAVILSGTGSDGAQGIREIKAESGIVFVQEEKSAKYPGMPRSAIDTGCVDYILPPKMIASELARISRHPYMALTKAVTAAPLTPETENDFNKIFVLIRAATGVDFTYYKRSSIMRRLERRMVLNKIEKIENYVRFLQENPSEVKALYDDILINVTNFFREPEAFSALTNIVFPEIVKNISRETPIRVWVPGCSTGEEAYSIAICLLEFLEPLKIAHQVVIFATDIDEAAIEKARDGVYPESISHDVSSERLNRFFLKAEGGYQIIKSIREMCVFAKQNIIKDPPFSKMDLISCRNLLIYLGPVLQKKVIPILHYALNPTGFLMLGTSETIGEFSSLFSLLDKKNKIYSKKSALSRLHFDSPATEPVSEKVAISKKMDEHILSEIDIQKEADRIVLNKYSPVGVMINDDIEILQFRGHTSPYLEPAPGQASLNLFKMAREGLMLELRTAIQKAKKEDITVRKDGVQVRHNSQLRDISIEVIPFKIPTYKGRYYLILFEEVALSPIVEAKPVKRKMKEEDRYVIRLEHELAATKEHLNSVIAEHEASNEELRALNEELQSSNEELQSMNEEMETAKEELQSTNEELTTVNDELQNRNIEIAQINSDLLNILGGVEIPIVLLGNELQIRRFNSSAGKVLNLIPTDVGRPISDIKPAIKVPAIEQMIFDVINTLVIKEQEIQDHKGRWYSMTIRPYKTIDNKIDGVLITIVDIHEIKLSNIRIKEARDYAQSIVETVREPLVILSADLKVLTANQSFYQKFQVTPEETENIFLYDLGNGQWNIPHLRNLLEEIIPQKTMFNDFEVDYEIPDTGHRTMLLNARRIYREDIGSQLILLAIEDITERKQTEKDRERLILELQEALSKVKTLSKLLPICASCKKIRDDKGYWNQIEAYISEHTDTLFSHGLCPDCLKKMYADFEKEDK